jgi:hypothetical protein
MATRWTKDQCLALLSHMGVSGAAKLRREVGGNRSEKAIASKALREYQTGSLTRGSYSLRALQEETGYAKTQLHRAQRALRQRWHRTRAGGNYMISLSQMDELTEWLKFDYWGPRLALYGCTWCTTQQRPHRQLGLCTRCYYQYRRRCKSAGLPTVHAEMLGCLERYRDQIDCGTLARMEGRLRQGLALSRRQLAALVQHAAECA